MTWLPLRCKPARGQFNRATVGFIAYCTRGWRCCSSARRFKPSGRELGRAGRGDYGGRGGKFAGGAAAAAGRGNAQPRGGRIERTLQGRTAAESRASAGRDADSEIREEQTAEIVTRPSKSAGESRAATAECSSLRRRRHADGSLQLVRDGRGNGDAGGDGIQRGGRGKFWVAVLLVRGGGAATREQQLAAIDGGSQSAVCAAGGGHF